jgi:hypothetical protein
VSFEETALYARGMAAAYATAGVDRFAAWAHETDADLRADLGFRDLGRILEFVPV